MLYNVRRLSGLLLGFLLVACGGAPVAHGPTATQTIALVPTGSAPAEAHTAVLPSPTATLPALPATETPRQITLSPSATATPITMHAEPRVTPSPLALVSGQVVLEITSGSAAGQIGITPDAGPTTFRVAADGSLRIMDTVNKRLLFYQQGNKGAKGELQKTIDLASLKRPADFAVTPFGDVFVLDLDGWSLANFSIDGTPLGITPIHPSLKGLFSTISLTADGSLWGVGRDRHYSIIMDSTPSPADVTQDASFDGAVTVRSAAYFTLSANDKHAGQSVLTISNLTNGTPIRYDLGQLAGEASFLDINQGMEPYILVESDGVFEIRRYSIQGNLLGTLTLDQQSCRSMSRSIYVDRPGDVYTMCVTESGATITRHEISDAKGQPLPRFDQLVTTAPWSPATLQAAPG